MKLALLEKLEYAIYSCSLTGLL